MAITTSTNSAPTYELIQTYTLASAGSFTFSSIPQTYTDLVLITKVKSNGGSGCDIACQINGQTGNIYYDSYWSQPGGGGTKITTRSAVQARWILEYNGSASSTLGDQVNIHYFNNYTNTNLLRTSIGYAGRWNGTGGGVDMVTHMMSYSSALNSIYLFGDVDTLGIGSTASLYGIKGA